MGICPAPSEDEYLRLPMRFSTRIVGLMVVGMMSLAAFVHAPSNLSFHNYSMRDFSAEEFAVAGLSLGFSPTPSASSRSFFASI